MKKILLPLFILLTLSGFAQKRTTPYDFPIKPRTKEWKFSSSQEMYEKCQIPPDILYNLTTEALAKTCLNYPLFGLMNAFNTPQAGFNAVKKNFNGIGGLLERKDAGRVLLSIYKTMDPANIDKGWSSLERGNFSELFRFIEILLAQSIVQNNMDDGDKKELLKELKVKYDAKTNILEVFGTTGLQSSLYPAAIVLEKKGLLKNKNNGTVRFLETGQLIEEADLTNLYNQLNANQ